MSVRPGTEFIDDWPAVGFTMRAGAKLIVEAHSGEAAAQTYAQVLKRDPGLKGRTAKLAPNLFFAQAQQTGNYWIFTHDGCRSLSA